MQNAAMNGLLLLMSSHVSSSTSELSEEEANCSSNSARSVLYCADDDLMLQCRRNTSRESDTNVIISGPRFLA